jgi:hypothetical protein
MFANLLLRTQKGQNLQSVAVNVTGKVVCTATRNSANAFGLAKVAPIVSMAQLAKMNSTTPRLLLLLLWLQIIRYIPHALQM